MTSTVTFLSLSSSVEEDFTAWKIKLWAAVCETYGVTERDDVNQRQYELIVHGEGDISEEKVFKGEVGRINQTIDNQKGLVF